MVKVSIFRQPGIPTGDRYTDIFSRIFFMLPAVVPLMVVVLESLELQGASRWRVSMKPPPIVRQKCGGRRAIPACQQKHSKLVTTAIEEPAAQPESREECRAKEPSLRIQLLKHRYEMQRMNHVCPSFGESTKAATDEEMDTYARHLQLWM